MVAVLTVVGIISGTFLATVGLLTKERIELNKKREIERAILAVVPGTQMSQVVHEEKDLVVYGGKTAGGELLGFAIYAAGIGFQDKIILMLGVDPSLARISALTILEQKETPGLGAKISDRESFLVYWENKDCKGPLRIRKPRAPSPEDLSPNEVNTITGATISSDAVLGTVNSALEKVKMLMREGKLLTGEQNDE